MVNSSNSKDKNDRMKKSIFRAAQSTKPWCVRMRIKFPYNTIMEISDLPEGLPFDLLKRVLADECSDNVKNIRLYYEDTIIKSGVSPKRLFKDLSVIPEIECRFKHPSQTTKINLGRRTCKLSRTDNITIYIYKGPDIHKDKLPDNLEVNLENNEADPGPHIVEIHWAPDKPKKPFLGGYRRKVDDVIFHNASSQTFPKPPKTPPVPITSRETQTYRVKHFQQDTRKDASTAMSKPGFFVTNAYDIVIKPRPYETADEYDERLNRCAIIIQKNVRRWLAKRRVAKIRELRKRHLQLLEENEKKYLQEKAERFNNDYERRLNPKKTADIDRLFNALEEWRLEKLNQIHNSSASLVVKKADMGTLLEKEIDLLRKITQKQNELSVVGKIRAEERLIRMAARTSSWMAGDNTFSVTKETQDSIHARKLLMLYENLKIDCLTKTERMDLLLTVKKLAGSYPSYQSCDLISLVERETELLLRDIPAPMLAGLRARILQRFIQFCKDPECNPSIAPYLPIPKKDSPSARAAMWEDTHRCISCGHYLRTNKFGVSAQAKRLGVCSFCWRQCNRGRDRLDLEPYRLILKSLRESEANLVRGKEASIGKEAEKARLKALDEAVEEQKRRRLRGDFTPVDVSALQKSESSESLVGGKPLSDHLELLVNVHDIYYLVSKVWDGRSALSGCSDLGDLVLCRWILSEPWSPWNTLLLTKKEAELHMELKDIPPTMLYADTTLTRVRQRLVIGKNAFVRLCKTGKEVTRQQLESGLLKRLPLGQGAKLLYTTSAEGRHKATIQPPDVLLPVISGEKKMQDLGISSIKELWPMKETVEEG